MSEWYVVSREPAPGQAGSGISENLAQFANESLAKEFARRIYLEGKFIEARRSLEVNKRYNRPRRPWSYGT